MIKMGADNTKSRIPKIMLSAGMIQSGLSGVGRYVVELAKRMAKMKGADLHIAGMDADRPLFPDFDDSHWVTIPGRYSSGAKNLLWHQIFLPCILKKQGFDLLHIPSYRRILAFCPIPQIATIHDCAAFRLRAKYDFLRGFFGRQVVPAIARRCDAILTVSEFTKQDLVKYFKLSSEQIEVVYNGLSHDAFHSRPKEEIENFKKEKGIQKPFFLFLSRLEHPGKNHVRLIKAFERFLEKTGADMELYLGGAPWHGAEVIQDCAAKSTYSDAIKMPGFIEEKELPLWYASCEGMVFPSLFEGFGLPLVEAMASGVGVLSSNRGSLPEVGGDAALYFDPENINEMSAAMENFYSENATQKIERLKKGGKQSLKFNWDFAANLTYDYYLKYEVISPKRHQ